MGKKFDLFFYSANAPDHLATVASLEVQTLDFQLGVKKSESYRRWKYCWYLRYPKFVLQSNVGPIWTGIVLKPSTRMFLLENDWLTIPGYVEDDRGN